MGYDERCDVSELVGKTLKDIHVEEAEAIFFLTEDGVGYRMYHSQDCCEGVSIESIVGDLKDLIGTPMLVAEERTSRSEEGRSVPDHIWVMSWEAEKEHEYEPESYTWTFYTFRTIKGTVDIRWYGTSNGYYSESVDFDRIAP